MSAVNTSPPARDGLVWAIALSALALLALRLHVMLRLTLNWDEFHYLSFVYDFVRDAPLTWRQTFHVHLFSWLTALPRDEVAQLVVARVVLLALGAGTCVLLYLVDRRFLSQAGALFAVLCYNALSEVFVHGASFRPDPLATFLLAAAAAAALARPAPIAGAAGAGALLALSFMFTFKTVFFAPSVALLVLVNTPAARGWRRRLLPLATMIATGLAALALLAAFHRQAVVAAIADADQVAVVQRLAGGLLWTGHWFPGRYYLLRSFEHNAVVWLLLGGGLVLAIRALRTPGERARLALPMLALALPLGTLALYRNAFPYFLAYLLAPAVVLCGLGLDRLRLASGPAARLRPVLAAAVVAGVLITGVTNYLRQLPYGLTGQRMLTQTVHRMFPEPVPYLDRCSMIASFPKVGFFMSSWGMERYARLGQPALSQAVRQHAPPLLIANTEPLNPLLPDAAVARLRYRLLAEDRRTLRQNYVHHWGAIFVAGKQLRLAAGETAFEILIPGPYTLEGDLAVTIDGRPVRPGEVIDLATGGHRLESAADGLVTLRWGDRLYRPASPPPRAPIFISL